MRLRLANLLAKVGNFAEVVPLLVGLADELANAGESRKAIAILKKIERLHRRDVKEICLAPLSRQPGEKGGDETADDELRAILDGSGPATPEDRFRGWLLDLVRDAYGRGALGRGPRKQTGATPGFGSTPGALAG